MSRGSSRSPLLVPLLVPLVAVLAACTATPSAGGPANPAATAGPAGGASPQGPLTPTASAAATATVVPEPTTTNTLPPPPDPTAPAPRRAGDLTAASLPVPAGWRTVATKGGPEAGYLGNGSWVQARDPRYAAFESITMGCAPVTRDDYPDPTRALEGTYQRGDDAGVGLTLQFTNAERAGAYLSTYRAQVARCTDPDVLRAEIVDSASGLVDRRTYPDSEWTEVAAQHDRRVTIVLLTDPGHRMTTAQTDALLARIAVTATR